MTLFENPCLFAEKASNLSLRSYQQAVTERIIDSVINKRGDSIVVKFARQSGKNETQAQIECYLLVMYSPFQAEMVKVSPTWKPQSQNAMERLERVLKANHLTKERWGRKEGYIYSFGRAAVKFLSGQRETHIVGATANVLLEVDEAQDVDIAKYDKEIAPMAASTNATRVFWGTAWTTTTLLSREEAAAREAEKQDGRRRVFIVDADQIGEEVPSYKKYVAEQVAKLGRNHPNIKTQYYCEDIDAQAGMFPPGRRALMMGPHPKAERPERGRMYAFLIDVAGEDEMQMALPGAGFASLMNPRRDATILTIVEVDLSSMEDTCLPTYRVANRFAWVGERHTTVNGRIRALAEAWNPAYLIIDATGVGEGLASLLHARFGERVKPIKFTPAVKSELGWQFLAIIETGRYREYDPFDEEFAQQLDLCQSEILPGPAHTMRWGVPDGTRDQQGHFVHDDMVISAAMCSCLDALEWKVARPTGIINPAQEPLREMDERF